MPNYCDFEMRVKGSKEAIERVVKCLTTDYNYMEGKPEHKHFFRVFSAEECGEPTINADGTFTQTIFGYCAWSVYSCMCEGGSSYYSSVKAERPDIFMGTTLKEQSQDCIIEVFSEEPGMAFSEHYIYDHGECVCDTEDEIESGGYDENDKPTTDIDWETYEGDTIVFNPNRANRIGDYLWAY